MALLPGVEHLDTHYLAASALRASSRWSCMKTQVTANGAVAAGFEIRRSCYLNRMRQRIADCRSCQDLLEAYTDVPKPWTSYHMAPH